MRIHALGAAVVLVLLCLHPGRAEQPAVKPLEKPVTKPVVVPFEMLKSGHMAVMIRVNGKGPYRVIFDTGAPINLFNNKLAEEADLFEDAPKTVLPFIGTIAEVHVKDLQVGSAKASDQPGIVMDHPLVELMSKKLGGLYGIVGFPFFARYKMTIDYKAQTLTLLPNGYKPENVMESLQSSLLKIMTGGSPSPKLLAPAAQWGLLVRKQADDEAAGVDIREVLPGSAAAEAGFKAGDRLLTIDDRWTDTLPDLYEIAGHLNPGATVPVTLTREGKKLELKIKLRAGL